MAGGSVDGRGGRVHVGGLDAGVRRSAERVRLD